VNCIALADNSRDSRGALRIQDAASFAVSAVWLNRLAAERGAFRMRGVLCLGGKCVLLITLFGA
jgi:hypothetical protein